MQRETKYITIPPIACPGSNSLSKKPNKLYVKFRFICLLYPKLAIEMITWRTRPSGQRYSPEVNRSPYPLLGIQRHK